MPVKYFLMILLAQKYLALMAIQEKYQKILRYNYCVGVDHEEKRSHVIIH